MLEIISNFKRFVKKNYKRIYYVLFFCVFGCFWYLLGFCVGRNIIQKDSILVYGDILKVSDILNSSKVNVDDSVGKSISEDSHGVEYYVASSRGKYYYPNTCSLGKSLSPKNLIKFKTEKEAQNAGYVYNTRCN